MGGADIRRPRASDVAAPFFWTASGTYHRLEERVLLSTFTVTNTLDNSRAGSLRHAINQVNADKGNTVDTIDFNIPGTGPFTISPTSPLPAITHSVLIDGYSQPHSSPNTETDSDNAVILIQLSGTQAGFCGRPGYHRRQQHGSRTGHQPVRRRWNSPL